MVSLLLRWIGKQRGAVALEAMLSIVLLFCAFYCMWGVALVIYNQSRLNTAAQLASQSALLVFDRSTYRGINPKNTYVTALNRANHVAWSVYKENSCGMLPDQFTAQAPQTGCDGPVGQAPPNFSISIECSPTLTAGYTPSNCYASGLAQAQALRVRIDASTDSPFDLLFPFRGFNSSDSPSVAHLSTEADAYSFAAAGKVNPGGF